MAPLLIRNPLHIATFDDRQRELSGHDVLIDGTRISRIAPDIPASPGATVIDAAGMLCMPGLVNCHHHLYQTLTRNVPRVQNAELFEWLTNLYEIWRELTPELTYISALVGLGELLLTGCTTSTDHLYLFPRAADGKLIDAEIRAARDLGIRFHPTRGCMTRGKSHGGLPPDDVVQTEEEILEDCKRLIGAYHDASPDAMLKVGVAPCSPFSVEETTMVKLAELARRHRVRLHTHMAETRDEETYCQQVYGMRPLDWAEKIGWLGEDVWFAHVVHVTDAEIEMLASTGTGVAHCPASNMRLGSGICPVPKMLEHGVRVGLGVDGSASNDTSDMLAEVRNTMLLQRVAGGAAAIDARMVLRIGCRGGAQVLGYPNLGTISEGAPADLVLIDLSRIDFAGALHDPLAAVVFAGASHRVAYTIVNGEVVVERSQLQRKREADIASAANDAAREMITAAEKKTGIRFRELPNLYGPTPTSSG